MSGFTWKVAIKGYDWGKEFVSPKFGSGWQAIHRGESLAPVEWKFRTYEPLKEHSGLFRTFAATPTSREAIRAFASEYGHLGEGGLWAWGPSKGMSFESDDERQGYEEEAEFMSIPQLFEEWEKAINEMRKAVDLWDRVRTVKGDTKSMRELQEVVDQQLNEVRIVARFEITQRPACQPALHIVPSTLGGAMWLQFAQAIAGNRQLRQCKVCDRWFALSPEIARTSKYYCSEACRSRAYRARKERARQLAADGKTPKKIAKELGCKLATIEEWLKHRKGE